MQKASKALRKISRQASLLMPSNEKLIQAGVEIAQEPDAVERSYLARQLVQVTLPHSDPGDVPVFTRTNGNVTLVLARTGYDAKKKQLIGYPYGSLPRLLLHFLNTEAVRTGNRRIELAHTFSAFIRQLGLDASQGGPRSDFKRLREQMRRLFSAAVHFQATGSLDGSEYELVRNMSIAVESALWWTPKAPDQAALFGSYVVLGEAFFRSITACPVPSDLRALRALRRSPLALDLYCWATYKAYTAYRTGKDQFVPWIALMQQFGSSYADSKHFKWKAVEALKKIALVYPGLQLREVDGGVTVMSTSRPAIPPAR